MSGDHVLAVVVPFLSDLFRGMRVPSAIAIGVGCLGSGPTHGYAQSRTIDITTAKAYFMEAERVAAEDAGRLWSASLQGPMILVDPATRFAVANLPDSGGVLSPVEGVYVGTLPRERPVANTAVEWGGRRWTMLLWPLPEDHQERRRLFAHEMFHRVQPALGMPAADPVSPHLGSAAGRTWLRLEWRALARALRTTGVERTRAIGDALAFRAYRRGLFPGAAEAEGALELNEGLAEYTGVKLSGPQDTMLAEQVADRLGDYEGRESLERSFAYASGPAYGVLLDATGVAWRGRIAAEADLGTLLAGALKLPDPTDRKARSRARVYGSGAVSREESRRARALAARQAELRARFVDGPRLVLPMAGNVNFSFDPGRASVIDGVGTVYESAEVSAAWGVLTVRSGGALFLQGDRGFTGIAVPASAAVEVPPHRGDGWQLDLAEGWRIGARNPSREWRVTRASQ